LDLAGLVHAGLMPPEQDVNSRWKPDPARILPALVAWIAAAALVLPMADTKAQGASAGTEGESMRVTGSVSYRERVALAPGSLVIVTLEDTSRADAPATTLGEARITIGRNQVPIPFVIEVEAGRIDPRHRHAVRARILDPQGALRWTSTQAYPVLTGGHPSSVDVQVEGIGSQAASTGAAPPRSGTLVFTCDDVEFLVRVGSNQVELVLPDRTLVLPQVPAASGAKYQQGRTLFWNRGDEARIEVEGKVYPACTRRPG